MTHPTVEQYLAGDIGTTQDPRMRAAEVVDLVRQLEARTGRPYNSQREMANDLDASAAGGGFGIPTVLRGVVAAILTAPSALEPTSLRLESAPTPLTPEVVARLGVYVYALRDPRDNSVFYVGKGRGNRVYSHVWAALGVPAPTADAADDSSGDTPQVKSAKLNRIREIHGSDRAVEHWIIRHAITPGADDDRAAFAVEQAMIDVLRLQETSPTAPVLTNTAGGHTDTDFGATSVEELACRYTAAPIPELPYPCIVVKVNGTATPYLTEEQIYEMARRSWRAGKVRHLSDIPVIVFAETIVRAVYRVTDWTPIDKKNNTVIYEFTGESDDELTAAFVGRRILPSDAGYVTWPMQGWAPRLSAPVS